MESAPQHLSSMLASLREMSQVTLFTSAQARALDRLAITRFGQPGIRLMRRAGQALYEALYRRWPETGSLTIFCGKGNNAGDGLILAGIARNRGWRIQLLHLAPLAEMTADAGRARDWALQQGVIPEPFTGQSPDGEIVVDALLGTGVRGPVSPQFAAAIEGMNSSGKPVVAADVPSGIDADTGAVLGSAVRACLTVTFIVVKRGLVTGQGPAFVGELQVADLDVPAAVFGVGPKGIPLLRLGDNVMPPGKRTRTAHKGDFGRVLILGGEHGYGGAALLAAEAALRAGAGLVYLGTRASHVAAAIARRPEIMAYATEDAAHRQGFPAHIDVLACGPGLGQSAWGRQLLELALRFEGRLILDADALNLLSAEDGCSRITSRRYPTILTPHPGEAARLLGMDVGAVERDRFQALDRLLEITSAWVVLKGAGSLLGAPGRGCSGLCGHGNPGMATAGMGDVLSGILAGLWAQFPDPERALALACCTHAAAADVVAGKYGERGLLASDIAAQARLLLNH